MAKGGLSLLHALIRRKCPISQHVSMHFKRVTGAPRQRQGVMAIQICGVRHVLHMEPQHRESIAVDLLTLHGILIDIMVHRKALVQEEALHRRMYGAAARRDLARLLSRRQIPLPVTEQLQLLEYAVPILSSQRVFNPHHSRKRMRYVDEMEEQEELHPRGGG